VCPGSLRAVNRGDRQIICEAKTTDKDGNVREVPKGIGSRMIQLISLLLIVPVVTLLAFEGSVTAELTGTLLGSIIGYTLGSLTKDTSN
jgi:hypothetical protein